MYMYIYILNSICDMSHSRDCPRYITPRHDYTCQAYRFHICVTNSYMCHELIYHVTAHDISLNDMTAHAICPVSMCDMTHSLMRPNSSLIHRIFHMHMCTHKPLHAKPCILNPQIQTLKPKPDTLISSPTCALINHYTRNPTC